jgi:hypothetical protein
LVENIEISILLQQEFSFSLQFNKLVVGCDSGAKQILVFFLGDCLMIRVVRRGYKLLIQRRSLLGPEGELELARVSAFGLD